MVTSLFSPVMKRLDYFNALEVYAAEGNLAPFIDFIAALEEARLDEYLTLLPGNG